MKRKIDELIKKQRGDGIIYTGWYCQNCDEPREGVEVTYHEHCAVCKAKLLEMEVYSRQEIQIRELLALLIKSTLDLVKYTYPMPDEQIKMIVKELSKITPITWDEISQNLEKDN